MNTQLVEQPKAVFWFHVYAGCMAAMYALVAVVGVVLMVFSDRFPDQAMLIAGPLYISLGLTFCAGYAVSFFFKPSPFSWVYDLVLICIGFGGCPTIAAAIPLLIFWIKPETKAYFGKS